jgi:acyl-CoA synthetase (AMP-forming)/AMP-acid ligase II
LQMLHNAYVGSCTRIAHAFEPGAMIRILREESISIAAFVPTMIQTLLQHPDVATAPYPTLALIGYGASPIASSTLRRAIEVFGCRFVQAYGMTETTAVVTHLSPEDHLRALASDERLLLSCGRPLMGTQLRIVDQHDREVPCGSKGEILVRGDQVMSGYWNRSAATAETLRDGWLHTGDAGHVDEDGFLFLSDRVKDMIVSGGENVYPREIEETLMRLDGIADVAVVGVPDERWGEVPKAFVVHTVGASLTAEMILNHCRSRLAGYKCPRSVEFVESLPRNATGKVLKRELRAPYWSGRTRAVN